MAEHPLGWVPSDGPWGFGWHKDWKWCLPPFPPHSLTHNGRSRRLIFAGQLQPRRLPNRTTTIQLPRPPSLADAPLDPLLRPASVSATVPPVSGRLPRRPGTSTGKPCPGAGTVKIAELLPPSRSMARTPLVRPTVSARNRAQSFLLRWGSD